METPLFGNYRAKVIDSLDPDKYGRVKVWIPDIMPEVDDSKGLWARPANNPVGGRNIEGSSEHHFMGSCYVPQNGAWVWVFFEAGNINSPYYFGALDLENTKVLPECQEANYNNKWVVFKSPQGRCVVISDDDTDARVEITGKKRQMWKPPSGDQASVYNIDDNQTTILLDEIEGREKLLIRTWKGDFIHVDIDQQKLQCFFKGDIVIETEGTLNIKAGQDIKIRSDMNTNIDAGMEAHLKSGLSMFQSSGAEHHTKAAGNLFRDAADIKDQGGGSQDAKEADPALPDGTRQS